MIVSDLLVEDSLQLRLHTPSSQERLSREISWCAPTEIMDPTPFLSRNVLLLTNGIGLNIEDERTWQAYVERLARVPVAAIAFGTGTAHRLIPAGLICAAGALDVPLLEIPRTVPFLQVHRHVTNVLQAERYATVTKSWELAQVCADLVSSGVGLRGILSAASKASHSQLAVIDATGAVIAKSPATSVWTEKELNRAVNDGSGTRSVPLPMGSADSFQLVARSGAEEQSLATLLAPAASIIAVQLKSALQTTSRKQKQFEMLLDQVPDWQGVALEQFTKTFRSTGLNVDDPTFVVVAAAGPGNLANAWRIRLVLQDAFDDVRILMRSGVLMAFAQKPSGSAVPRHGKASIQGALLRRFRLEMPQQALVLKGPCAGVDELRIGVHQAGGMVGGVTAPALAPELGIGALIASTASHGARNAARQLLEPVIAYDQAHAGHLFKTLEQYLSSDCQPSRAAAELFIHRNTLSQRITKLESLLNLRLSTLEGQATCLMAVKILAG